MFVASSNSIICADGARFSVLCMTKKKAVNGRREAQEMLSYSNMRRKEL